MQSLGTWKEEVEEGKRNRQKRGAAKAKEEGFTPRPGRRFLEKRGEKTFSLLNV